MHTPEPLHTTPARAEPPDHFPTIITETGLHEHVASFEVDITRISELLIDNGLTPAQIDETTIVFSAARDKKLGVEAAGRYNSPTKSTGEPQTPY